MKKSAISTINEYIEKGLAERDTDSKACSAHFLTAWMELLAATPATYTDFITLIEAYNTDEASYDWYAWVFDICEEYELLSHDRPESIEQRLQFIESFNTRFPDTEDEDLQEFLLRNLIKSYFLLGKDVAGEQAVVKFYQQFPHSVWGYIEWGDALLTRTEHPSPEEVATILAIYKKGLKLEDDSDFMDILKRRIRKVTE